MTEKRIAVQRKADDQKEMVLVLGAGASVEVGLPAGNALKTEIANILDFDVRDGIQQKSGDRVVLEAFNRVSQEEATASLHKILIASTSIRNAMPQALSIDNFLDAHSENRNIEIAGKIAITRAILNAEARSSLYLEDREAPINFKALENTWFNRFFQSVSENCKFIDLKERLKTITIISFNYDRCFKHFMRHAIQNYYCVDAKSAYEAVAEIEVLYPYGSTGTFAGAGNPGVDFGANPSALKLNDISKQIKTFTEQVDEKSNELKRIRSCLEVTKKILFLGFAYHPLNMELLFPKNNFENKNCQIFGTALQISWFDIQSIKQNIMARVGTSSVELDDTSCFNLYGTRWRTLSMAK